MDAETLKNIVTEHGRWLRGENPTGRANLRGAILHDVNLGGANLSGANLSGVNLACADLRGTDLSGADLRDANLSGTDLSGANLQGAMLRFAILDRAILHGTDLSGATLRAADLCGADLCGTDLCGADLTDADLTDADLTDAALQGANLYRANLIGAVLGNTALSGIRIDWRSHDLVAELLFRAAGNDPEKRKVAGLVMISRDWCWEQFVWFCSHDPLWDWAIGVLASHVRDGDDAPDILTEKADRMKKSHHPTREET